MILNDTGFGLNIRNQYKSDREFYRISTDWPLMWCVSGEEPGKGGIIISFHDDEKCSPSNVSSKIVGLDNQVETHSLVFISLTGSVKGPGNWQRKHDFHAAQRR